MIQRRRQGPRRGGRTASAAAWAVVAALFPLAALAADAPNPPAAAAPVGGEVRPIEYQRWHTNEPGQYLDYNQRATLIQRGKEVYQKYCAGCHGDNGDGNGPAAKRLITKPRDFTRGMFKFRSTDSSSLPLDTDLYRTITRGLPRVSMPAFPLMPEREKVEVIEYIKTFYPRWEERKNDRVVVPVPRAPQDLGDKARIDRGHFVYVAVGCAKCHGVDGQGKGATLKEYVDAWGHPQKPFNFTRGRLKGGDDPEDIYRTFHTGLVSIMPSFGGNSLAAPSRQAFDNATRELPAGEADALKPVFADFPPTTEEVFTKMEEKDRHELAERNSWDLVAFILSLRHNPTTAEAVLGLTAAAPPAAANGGKP